MESVFYFLFHNNILYRVAMYKALEILYNKSMQLQQMYKSIILIKVCMSTVPL